MESPQTIEAIDYYLWQDPQTRMNPDTIFFLRNSLYKAQTEYGRYIYANVCFESAERLDLSPDQRKGRMGTISEKLLGTKPDGEPYVSWPEANLQIAHLPVYAH